MAANKYVQKAQKELTTTDATVITILTITIPSGHSVTGRLMIVSRNTSGGATKDFQGPIAAKNVVGTVTTSSSITNLLSDEATAVSLSTSGNDMLIRITGIAANTIDWYATYDYIEN